jgi:hypothetical protein
MGESRDARHTALERLHRDGAGQEFVVVVEEFYLHVGISAGPAQQDMATVLLAIVEREG